MPELITYKLFVSHSWKYGSEYDRLIEFLDDASNFKYKNYSAPEEKPLELNGYYSDKAIREAITRKIRPADTVLVLSGMYTAYSGWMQYEIDEAVRMSKPIIGIKPWGSIYVPQYVKDNADIIVGWNTKSIVDAIRDYSPATLPR